MPGVELVAAARGWLRPRNLLLAGGLAAVLLVGLLTTDRLGGWLPGGTGAESSAGAVILVRAHPRWAPPVGIELRGVVYIPEEDPRAILGEIQAPNDDRLDGN